MLFLPQIFQVKMFCRSNQFYRFLNERLKIIPIVEKIFLLSANFKSALFLRIFEFYKLFWILDTLYWQIMDDSYFPWIIVLTKFFFFASGVAQSVVDKVVRMHRDHFETEVDDNNWRREDVSLLVRNFNAKLANIKRNKSTSSSTSNPGTPSILNNLDAVTNTMTKESAQKQPILIQQQLPDAVTRSSTTTDSSADTFLKQEKELSLDENGRIKPYVDFSYFHNEWAKRNGNKDHQEQNGVWNMKIKFINHKNVFLVR